MKIKIAIIDNRVPHEGQRELMKLGFKVITLPSFSRLGKDVASHTDMLITRLGDTFISHADYCDEAPYVFQDLYELLSPLGTRFSFVSDEIRAEYPFDARLNVLSMAGKLFCRRDTVSEYIINRAHSLGIEIVNVMQGYPACTTLKLNEHAAITSDNGMFRALSENGVRVTLIESGHISLPPHPYGFIGGCAGVYMNTVYFLGNVTRHPSFGLIERAITDEGLNIVSLTDGILTDLGGILFVEGYLDEYCEERH